MTSNLASGTVYQRERLLAIDSAIKAGKIIRRYFGEHCEVKFKSKDQPVTIADHEANSIIKKTLLTAFPADGWLSEEDLDEESRLKCERVWIVDPLDGTKEFINKNPEFVVSIALCVKNEIVVGVLYNPITEDLFWAEMGCGSFHHNQRLLPKMQSTQSLLLISKSEYNDILQFATSYDYNLKAHGGFAHKISLVLTGEYDKALTLKPKSEWDVAAGSLLLSECGACVLTNEGQFLRFNKPAPTFDGLVYAQSPELCHRIIKELKEFYKE